ncbi:WxL domain-containing protein [Enterococcus faecalis]|uniref:WxL domain-containing protein n=1 Tax=Enterococcus TaxID=1350 RepID=UPI0013B04B4D|nr:WxL domain-containing protein [Enterococcus faecalis]EGO5111206.1 WxL domain-containing protein [Enterococcus faecalis]EGO6074845.1 WxL domain-containing protein [Enterococcus faecalis]EGO6777892.1 WxL domain-containing protein [Enterococcus faecalis]EGO7771479.1 WxL domain-containing protein [Enterococcus faecalis]EHA4025222.1 WxL domain-containing protein [Enterococcus faecalis]
MSKFEISSGVFFGKINKKMLVISIDNNRILIKKGLYRDYRLNFYIERRSKMKRVNWKRWLVVGLSCSLFMDSVVGVTVLAETITGETEQGVATSQSSDEASQTTQPTEESQATVASEAKTEPPQETARIASRAIGYSSVEGREIPFFFVEEDGTLFDPDRITMAVNLSSFSFYEEKLQRTPLEPTTVNGGKLLSIPTSPAFKYDTNNRDPSNIYGVSEVSFTIPKEYQSLDIRPSTFYTGDTTQYPVPTVFANVGGKVTNYVGANAETELELTNEKMPNKLTFGPKKTFKYTVATAPGGVTYALTYFYGDVGGPTSSHQRRGTSGPVYYYLTKRRVTEKFENPAGGAIPAPEGFTQDKKTIVTGEDFTFTQEGTLPERYTGSDGKTYLFKGWYKGNAKPSTLETTKTPSYAVTYDDNDDLHVVYEEAVMKTYTLPAREALFGYVDEQGNLINPAKFKLSATMGESDGATGEMTTFPTIDGIDMPASQLKKLAIPQKVYTRPDDGTILTYGPQEVSVEIPKYYQTISIKPTTAYTGDKTKYPVPNEVRRGIENPDNIVSSLVGTTAYNLTKKSATRYTARRSYWTWDPTKTLYSMSIYSGTAGGNYNLSTPDGTIYYYLENRRVTEHFVDDGGAKITPPTGFTQGNQLVMDSENYVYTAAKTLPKIYQAGEKTYIFQGWFKGKSKPATLKTTTTPSFTPTFNDEDDMTAVYQEAIPTAELTLTGAVDIIENGATMDYWEALLKNTGEAPLTTIKIKPTATWAAGIGAPNTIFVQGTGQNTKAFPVTKEQWTTGAGVSITLDQPLPAGGQLKMNILGATVTGQPGQVLTADVEVTGNFGSLTAKDTVRIKDLDQEITSPDGDGFISTPTFDFGKLAISGSKQQYGLKKAADYYGNGTRNPYLRLNTSQANWSLTAQLSQPKSATDSLPTTTRLLLGTAAAASFTDYNQPTETRTPLGKTSTVTLTADNTATAVVANQQFTGSDVYQLDFTLANIKLEVPANQGMAGQQYQAAVTWNLVTGP